MVKVKWKRFSGKRRAVITLDAEELIALSEAIVPAGAKGNHFYDACAVKARIKDFMKQERI